MKKGSALHIARWGKREAGVSPHTPHHTPTSPPFSRHATAAQMSSFRETRPAAAAAEKPCDRWTHIRHPPHTTSNPPELKNLFSPRSSVVIQHDPQIATAAAPVILAVFFSFPRLFFTSVLEPRLVWTLCGFFLVKIGMITSSDRGCWCKSFTFFPVFHCREKHYTAQVVLCLCCLALRGLKIQTRFRSLFETESLKVKQLSCLLV